MCRLQSLIAIADFIIATDDYTVAIADFIIVTADLRLHMRLKCYLPGCYGVLYRPLGIYYADFFLHRKLFAKFAENTLDYE